MKSYLRYVVFMSLGAHLSMASGYDVVLELNGERREIYNAPLAPRVDPRDPMDLLKLNTHSTQIQDILTKNVNQKVHATKAQKKIALQAVFATELIYGDVRPSYLEGISATSGIYGHCYVLEYSALLAREFGAFGLDPQRGKASSFQTLYAYSGLDYVTLYEWYIEAQKQHQAGTEARAERMKALQVQKGDSPSDWEGTYLLKDGKTNVIHTPTGVRMDKLSHEREIYWLGNRYKEIELRGVINLETESLQEDFVNALIRSGAYEGTEEERRWYEISGNWTHTFTLRDGTQIRHTPNTLVIFPETEDEESIEDMCATEINRMRFKGMLRLHTKSSFTEFVRALKKANAI